MISVLWHASSVSVSPDLYLSARSSEPETMLTNLDKMF